MRFLKKMFKHEQRLDTFRCVKNMIIRIKSRREVKTRIAAGIKAQKGINIRKTRDFSLDSIKLQRAFLWD